MNATLRALGLGGFLTQPGTAPLDQIARLPVWVLPTMALLGVAVSGLEGLSIGLLVPLLASFFSGATMGTLPEPLAALKAFAEWLVPSKHLAGVAVLIVATMLGKAALQIVAATFSSRIEGQVGLRARSALFERLLAAEYSFFGSAEPARLVSIITEGTWKLSEAVRLTFGIVSAFATIFVFGVLLVLIEWRLSLAVAIGLLLVRWFQWHWTARLGALSEAAASATARVGGRTLSSVRSIRVIRLYAREQRERKRFETDSRQLQNTIIAIQNTSERFLPVLEVLETSLFMGVLLIASAIGTPAPVLAAFLVLLYRTQVPLLTINRNRLERAALTGAIKEIEWLLGISPQLLLGKEPLPAGIQAPIRFQSVSFRFPKLSDELQPALEQVNLTIPVGATVALIGPSGAGKSTLVNLLCGLLRPTRGNILIGETPIDQIDPIAWRSRIALAGQDVELIDGTVFENIAYGLKDATEHLVEEAARMADAHTFIKTLPAAYSERLGPSDGARLSGGERQRIGLARALLRRPDLLILDEATSAVDGPSERTIMALLRSHAVFRTAIVISHRRSTLALCDLGVVMKDGRVVEAGPLQTLKFYEDMEAGMIPR